jgi:predicted DNA-binding protein with PD1-like motif
MPFKKIHIFRVKPEQELAAEIGYYCRQHGITSGIVIGIIGSLQKAKLNYITDLPGHYEGENYRGPLEIVCAQGSIALKDDELIVHIHVQLADMVGCYGGHLAEAVVFSTAEVVIAELDRQISRSLDSYTGLNEIEV